MKAVPVEGRAAIAEFVQTYVDLFLDEKHPSKVEEVFPFEEMAVEVGTWHAKHAHGEQEGFVMRLWQREEGRWSIRREVFNVPSTEKPPRQPQA